ncbi:MAG: gas vesicle protein GvpO [Paracoccaceae bacterium]
MASAPDTQTAASIASSTTKPGLMDVVARARTTVAFLTELPVDAVAACSRTPEGWRLVIDVLEAKARSGENDLLASFAISLTTDGDITGIERIRRYHREEAEL